MRSNYLSILICATFISNSTPSYAQFTVERRACTFLNRYKGHKLILHYKTDTLNKESSTYGYDLDYFIKLSDSCKLILVNELLDYENDTSLCCIRIVGGYSLNGIEGCRTIPVKSDRYNLQIDALFMINRLCWPKLMELYSCIPALYDTVEKVDINDSPTKIKIVFEEYKKWYVECKSQGKVLRYFPFNDGRYVWAGGRKSLARRNE